MRDIDFLGVASLGGWLRKRGHHLLPVGTPCPNCETPLAGPYCYTCGQLGEQFERSIWRLFVETLESLFHFDGRMFRTLPRLAYKPGELTRQYLDGKRAYQIPPLRMFLVVLLVLFFVGGFALNNEIAKGKGPGGGVVNFHPQLTAAQKAALGPKVAAETQRTIDLTVAKARAKRQLKEAIKGAPPTPSASTPVAPATGAHTTSVHEPGVDLDFDDDDVPASKTAAPASKAAPGAVAPAVPAAKKADGADDVVIQAVPGVKMDSRTDSKFKSQLKFAMANKEYFLTVLEEKAHDWSILMLPLSAVLLTILFVFQRKFYVFDHLVFSMHSLSFQGLLLSLVMLLTSWGLPLGWLMWASPVHLFFHMRGAYGTSIFGTLLRMFLLFLGTFFGFVFLVMGVMMQTLSAMGH